MSLLTPPAGQAGTTSLPSEPACPPLQPVDRAAIVAAASRIHTHVRHTPLWRLPGAVLGLPGIVLWLKLEHLQRSGSFKARGMFNRILAWQQAAGPSADRLGTDGGPGVIVASGGNAGIAVADAAAALGLACEVFVPATVPAAKRARLQALGALVQVGGANYAEALAACALRQSETCALWMHAYDQQEVVAGAGTLAMEMEADAGLPDRVLVSVGGGGLIGGVAAWCASRCRVEALEPTGAPTLHAARAAGRPVDVEVGGLAADALGARRIGDLAWGLNHHIAAAHLVADADIAEAQRRLWRELRLAVEPAAALPLAALIGGCVRPQPGEQVALVLCGANFEPATLAG